jgi:hypothetical protein
LVYGKYDVSPQPPWLMRDRRSVDALVGIAATTHYYRPTKRFLPQKRQSEDVKFFYPQIAQIIADYFLRLLFGGPVAVWQSKAQKRLEAASTLPGNRCAWCRRTDWKQVPVHSVHNVHSVHFINR